jgi:hypothetical protein
VRCVLLALIFARLLNLSDKKSCAAQPAYKMMPPLAQPAIMKRLTVLL